VYLAFELVDAGLAQTLAVQADQRSDYWRLSALDGAATSMLLDADGHLLNAGWAMCARCCPPLNMRAARKCCAMGGRRWLADAVLAPRAHLVLFGAGHVGAAIVRLLGELPCTVSWMTSAKTCSRPSCPPTYASKRPMCRKRWLPAPRRCQLSGHDHSHALDQRLCEAIVARADVGWFGLIGSQTKRVQFERRMAARGLPAERIAAMVCPIGLPGIRSKPARRDRRLRVRPVADGVGSTARDTGRLARIHYYSGLCYALKSASLPWQLAALSRRSGLQREGAPGMRMAC
jgi:xanthine dehydrogenase accessory factor